LGCQTTINYQNGASDKGSARFDRQLLVVLKVGKSWKFQQMAGAKDDMGLKIASKFQKRN
jgi:hypothetical protein